MKEKQTIVNKLSAVKLSAVLPLVKQHKRMACGIAAALLLWVCWPSNSAKIGVLDPMALKEQVAAYKEITAAQKTYEEVWKTKFMAEKAVLDKEMADYKSKKQSAQQLQKIQSKAQELQMRYQAQAGKIAMATQIAAQNVDKAVIEAIRKIAKSKNYDLIFLKGQLAYISDKNDITKEVGRLVDKQDIKVSYPDPSQLQ